MDAVTSFHHWQRDNMNNQAPHIGVWRIDTVCRVVLQNGNAELQAEAPTTPNDYRCTEHS